jgi:hypothetical protein
MQHLRRLSIIAALVCAFAFSAYAEGNIECPVRTSPSPQPTVTGEIECTGLTDIALSLLQSVLSLS